ncbi:MAG: hypothetical protein LUE93_12885 [Bacteroides sp.]|nr:hypothetical protein [Bacteroides sp.]
MKKFSAAALALFAIAFQACDPDKFTPTEKFEPVGVVREVTITDVQNLSGIPEEVIWVGRLYDPSDTGEGIPAGGNYWEHRYMLRMPFNGEGMTLRLPEDPHRSLLRSIEKDFPQGMEISDRSAHTVSSVEIGFRFPDSERLGGEIMYYKKQGIPLTR